MSTDFISFDIPNSFSTEFTSNKIIELIKECLFELMKPKNITITEENYDPMYDKFEPHSNVAKLWNIELFKPLYDANICISRYIIRVTYLVGKNCQPNVVIFKDVGNVGGCGYVCEDRMFSLKYFITKKEKLLKLRYLEREPFLLLTNGSVTNYEDFSAEDLIQVSFEKMISKKLHVLENPWVQREILEYIDYVQSEIDVESVMGCFRRR